MPLTAKGEKILRNMQSEYGAKKGKSVFYASINKGKIKGAEAGGKVRESAAAERREHGGPLRERREENPRWDTEGYGGKVRSSSKHPMAHAKSNSGGRW